MAKKKLSEENVRFNNEIKKIVLDILEKNKKPMIEISLSDEKPNLFQSKFGGVPYLPKDKEAPKDKANRQLTLLAQINIDELPENNIYPMKEGILQFWILNDDILGLDYDTHLGDGYKIIYYKEIDKMYFKIKLKTEADIDQAHKTVGTYIYDTLLGNPSQKIRGRLVRTIERKYYKEELKLILDKQKEFHPELQDRALYAACVEELYTINEAHRNNIGNRDFTYLFLEDILFYQRPLKSKKSLIDNCPYEENHCLDKETG